MVPKRNSALERCFPKTFHSLDIFSVEVRELFTSALGFDELLGRENSQLHRRLSCPPLTRHIDWTALAPRPDAHGRKYSPSPVSEPAAISRATEIG
jgi:hypothetical protein